MIEVIQNNNNVLIEEVSPNEINITKIENTITISQVGQQGANGVGVPTGGTTGQVLAKIDGDNYNTEWVDQSGGGGAVDSVNSQTGVVVLDADDIDDSSTTNKFVTSTDLTNLSNLSGTNTGDQDLSGYAQDFTDLGDVPSSYTGQADKWVKVKTDELGLEFDDLPIADINTPGLIDVGGQTLSGGKFFASTFSDADNFQST